MSWKDIKKGDTPKSDFLKLKAGANLLRIMSEPETRSVHWVQAESRSYLCRSEMYGEPCEFCTEGIPSKDRYLFYVIDRTDQLKETGEVKIKLAEFGWTVLEALSGLQFSNDYAFESTPDYDVTITKTGEKLETTYTMLPARNNTKLSEAEILAFSLMNPLKDVIENMEKNVQKKTETEQKVTEFVPPLGKVEEIKTEKFSQAEIDAIPF